MSLILLKVYNKNRPFHRIMANIITELTYGNGLDK